jgi:LuxR family maltose regulon positive regulatory protein
MPSLICIHASAAAVIARKGKEQVSNRTAIGALAPRPGARFRPPAFGRGDVPRTALLKRLAGCDAPLVTVTAGAGYGKTTLLAQWAERDPRPAAWLTTGDDDADPHEMRTSVAAALSDIGHRRGSDEPLLLVVDEADRLSRESLALLAAVTAELPAGSTVAVAGRSDPALPVARMRAAERLVEIGPADLAMSAREARLVVSAAAAGLTAAETAGVVRAAEGWPAGLYLGALAALEHPTDSAPDRFLVDYLRAEVVGQLRPAADRRFLIRTAVLEELSAPLCDAVLQRSDSGRRLERLERTNSMLLPLDRHRGAYRLHGMMRQMLIAELELESPGASRELAGRAADWCDENGRTEQAIGYALAAGDCAQAASLVERHAMHAFHNGQTALVESWLRQLDGEPIERRPGLAVLAGWIHALRGRPREAEDCLAAAERGVAMAAVLDDTTVPRLALLRAALCPDGAERMQADAQFAVDSLDLLSPWRAKALLLVGWSQLLRGMDDAADATLTDAARASAAGLTNTSSIALAGRAVLACARGDLVGADGLATEGIERLISRSLTARATSAVCYAAGARTAAERGRVDAAREWLAAAHRLLPQVTHALPWMAVQSRLDAARAHLLLGEDEQAAAVCAEVEHLLLIRPRLGTLVGQAAEVRRSAARREVPDGWTDTLTAAELRLLPLLTTHLSFREIADRLFVSRNTVKTQAISVYRKLGASSRSEAVARAEALGLIELPARIIP